MTAPATTRRAGPFNGNGSTTSFPFTFKVFATSDIKVVRTSTTGLESVLVLGADYSVTLNADQDSSPGGAITYPISGSPLAFGQKLTVVGALPYDQPADLPTGGNYRAVVVENALDRATFQIQQLVEETDRALTLPVSAAGADTELPAPEANKVIGWNAAANALVNLDASDLASVVVAGTAYTDVFDGTGGQVAFGLTANPGSVNALDVAISGVSQVNGVDFTVSGTTLTFTAAPPSGTGNVVARYVQALPVATVNAQDVVYGATTAEAYMQRVVYADDEGAVGDGSTDDTSAIQDALDAAALNPAGGTAWLTSGKVYRIKQKLNVASNCGLASDGTAQLIGSYADFTNADSSGRYGSVGSFVDLSGQTSSPYTPARGSFCRGVKFVFEPPPDILTGGTKRSVSGIIARNVIDVDISGNEMSGFMTGAGIRVATLVDGRIVDNYIRDSFDNNDWTGLPASAQITGIEMDNDRVNSVGSYGTSICHNTIVNMVCGAQSISTGGGYQSDGINIAGLGGDSPHEIDVSHNVIRKCAEGIDHFGRNCTLDGNNISQVYTFGIKLVHGAQYNAVTGGAIVDFGLAGITLQGSNTAGDTKGNSVVGTVISNGDYLGIWTALGAESAGILFANNGGGTGKPRENTVTGVVINEGAACKNGWLDSSTGANNVGEGVRVTTGAAHSRRVLVQFGAGTCRVAGSGTYSTDLV